MTTPDETLDATGLLCPLPVLKARKRLGALASGQVLEIRADDPAARVDIPHFCTEQGHELLSQSDQENGVLVFLLRKA
ncbi:sulfurtransferase TusA family protein [Rhodobacteraceae bacterium NNCM2]|nr:sulfurtransferase TusA family protein [Coraliihabitans acroporae]